MFVVPRSYTQCERSATVSGCLKPCPHSLAISHVVTFGVPVSALSRSLSCVYSIMHESKHCRAPAEHTEVKVLRAELSSSNSPFLGPPDAPRSPHGIRHEVIRTPTYRVHPLSLAFPRPPRCVSPVECDTIRNTSIATTTSRTQRETHIRALGALHACSHVTLRLHPAARQLRPARKARDGIRA